VSALRVIGYVRVSTSEQADSGLGLDAQVSELERAAAYEGWQLTIIRDEGRTGANLRRPGIRKALRALAQGEYDGLAVAKLDRLSRSTADSAQLFHWFHEAEARLILLDLRVDTGTPTGSLLANFMAALAEWERRQIAARTKASLTALRAQGKPISRPAVIDQPELAARIRRLRRA
jgi:DNA invertase Pin-like site-specific DNA recombinase